MAMRVWGVSRLRDLKVCPALYVAKYETKRWVETPNPQMERGSSVHSSIENTLNYGIHLEGEAAKLPAAVQWSTALLGMKDNGVLVAPEFKFGLDKNFNKVDFFRAPDLRCRVGLDVLVNDSGKGLTIDWKTGRYKPEHMIDADFYGAAAAVAVRTRTMTTIYVYLDEPDNTFQRVIEKPESMMIDFYKSFDAADAYLDGEGPGGIRLFNPPINPGRQCAWCGNVACPKNDNVKAKALAIKPKDIFQ
jgi:hypothetical protein